MSPQSRGTPSLVPAAAVDNARELCVDAAQTGREERVQSAGTATAMPAQQASSVPSRGNGGDSPVRASPRTKELASVRAAAHAQMASAEKQYAQLEARWAEVSAVSDEALRQKDEARQQVAQLRREVEERDTRLAESVDLRLKLEAEKNGAVKLHQDLEANFAERLQREVTQKQQEVLDEVQYLKKSIQARDTKLQEAAAEKARLERRILEQGGGISLEEGQPRMHRQAMLEAHTAIARAFGDVYEKHPLVKIVDEPLLKATTILFKQPLARRAFFFTTVIMWVLALRHALVPQGLSGHSR